MARPVEGELWSGDDSLSTLKVAMTPSQPSLDGAGGAGLIGEVEPGAHRKGMSREWTGDRKSVNLASGELRLSVLVTKDWARPGVIWEHRSVPSRLAQTKLDSSL